MAQGSGDTRRVVVRMENDIYLELIRRYGVRSISKIVNTVLREFLFGEEEETRGSGGSPFRLEASRPPRISRELLERLKA